VRLRAVVIAPAVAAVMLATAVVPHVASASSHVITAWSCTYTASHRSTFDAPGVGRTFSWNTDYPSGSYLLVGTVKALETSTTTLVLVSAKPGTGWTDVVNKAGPPKVVVQFTNTGGGGGVPPNTLRLRLFFTIDPPYYQRITENIAVCVPAT
jgi:hypothetical protein